MLNFCCFWAKTWPHVSKFKTYPKIQYISYAVRVMNITDHDYKPILDSLNLRSLESHKTAATLILPFNLINGLVSCPWLLKLLNSYASARTFRKVNKFLARRLTFKFRNFHPIYKMCSIVNNFCFVPEFFSASFRVFKHSSFELL